MSNVSRLVHRDLLKPHGSYAPILSPREIPVHPVIFDSDIAYSPDFAGEVFSALPSYVKEDFSQIGRVLGIDVRHYMHEVPTHVLLRNVAIAVNNMALDKLGL